MATLTSTGVGSGLDVNGLVTQLVAADRAPQDARLTRIDTKLTTEFTALSQLKGSMASFQSALTSLKDASTLLTRSASLSDDTNLSASAGSSAVAGTYDVEVVQLAKAGQLNSAPLAGGPTTVVGTGTLTLSMGAKSFDVTIDSRNPADGRGWQPADPDGLRHGRHECAEGVGGRRRRRPFGIDL